MATGYPPIHLAEASARERDVRAKHYPKRIAAGETAEPLEADWQTWVAIAHWCAGQRIPFDIDWASMEAAAADALARRAQACRADPDDAALAAIHAHVRDQRQLIDELNQRLRQQAGREAA
jgi:hypothetical protein